MCCGHILVILHGLLQQIAINVLQRKQGVEPSRPNLHLLPETEEELDCYAFLQLPGGQLVAVGWCGFETNSASSRPAFLHPLNLWGGKWFEPFCSTTEENTRRLPRNDRAVALQWSTSE